MPVIQSGRTSNQIRPPLSEAQKTEAQKRLEAEKAEDLRMVKGVFKNLECPGGSVKFNVRKYKGEPVYDYLMFDGGEYEVPLHVAKHINNNCSYPIHKSSIDPVTNAPLTTIGKMVNRFAFISQDFR